MEGLFVMLILYWIVKSIGKKSKQKPKNAGAQQNAAARVQRAREAYEQAKNRTAAQPQPRTVQPTLFDRQPAEGEGYATMQPIQPFRGSMEAFSTEGEDLCDPELGHEREPVYEEGSVYENQITGAPKLDLSAQGVWQGVVMSEILGRPGGRRAAR